MLTLKPALSRVFATAVPAILLLYAAPAASVDWSPGCVVGHVVSHTPTGLECSSGPTLPCFAFVNQWTVGSGCDVWFVLARVDGSYGNGISGVSFGLEYPQGGSGLFRGAYTTCSDLAYPNSDPAGNLFPDSGGGIRLIWSPSDNCQRTLYPDGVQANLMAVYMYAYAACQMEVTPNRNLASGPEFRVLDCNLVERNLVWPQNAGVVGFGTRGYSPCTEVPVKAATWGRLKALYR